MLKSIYITLLVGLLGMADLYAQTSQKRFPYPDEPGYKVRMAGMLQKFADMPFGIKSMASSTCPDTGLPVRTWALKGETIYSPYTGKAYTQGDTGYFGPKKRNAAGQISAFGGDPLKKDLPPATAFLMLNPIDTRTTGFLSIPGNLTQQYHFAAKNWARFYGLLADQMPDGWISAFADSVGKYAEKRRPSDGDREHAFLSKAHTLVGEGRAHLLGGNMQDGGTENHKTMWRTSALVYAQNLPSGAKISGTPLQEAEDMTAGVLFDYLGKMLETGNGEYDSQIYYPHSIEAFLNLHDFSNDPAYSQLAESVLDYYLATYSLKTIDGAIAGAQKRGFLTGDRPNEMRNHLWAWFGTSFGKGGPQTIVTSMHQATSAYRPNKIIWNIAHKNVLLPFEAKMRRPSYHMNTDNMFQEYFYCDQSYGMGSVAMTTVDNPNQQVVWSLVVRGNEGPLSFGGMQPHHLAPAGHSYFTQQVQHKNTLLLLTASNERDRRYQMPEVNARWMTNARPLDRSLVAESGKWLKALEQLEDVTMLQDALSQLAEHASVLPHTWLFIPKHLNVTKHGQNFVVDAESAWVTVGAVGEASLLKIPDFVLGTLASTNKKTEKLAQQLKDYQILISRGEASGYAIEVLEKRDFPEKDGLTAQLTESRLRVEGLEMHYRDLQGDKLHMAYQMDGFRAKGSINGKDIDWENWADGAAYQSPYVQVKNGKMTITDGVERYTIRLRNGRVEVK